MKWEDGRRSDNVEDRRGMGGGGRGLPIGKMAGGGLGVIVIAVIVMLMGGDPSGLLGGLTESGSVGSQTQERPRSPGEDRAAAFVSTVLANTEDVWNQQMPRLGKNYVEPKLQLFTDVAQSACGSQSAAVGPFYCPGDSKVYLDLSFFEQLERELGAPGDFAQAYVIAHEIGHHIQNLIGVSRMVQDQQSRVDEVAGNDLSVRLELQADFFAGVWAHYAHAQGQLESGDFEEAFRAASKIGDDVLQKRARGYATPDSFTHGTAEQRARWFRKGFDTGDPTLGDTFNARQL
ncbi:MAG: neutral zinc metallopeptidase [Planctomycetota bacterium]|nr:neutral zinc metallopeptidase [Planctomycetota bacterium]